MFQIQSIVSVRGPDPCIVTLGESHSRRDITNTRIKQALHMIQPSVAEIVNPRGASNPPKDAPTTYIRKQTCMYIYVTEYTLWSIDIYIYVYHGIDITEYTLRNTYFEYIHIYTYYRIYNTFSIYIYITNKAQNISYRAKYSQIGNERRLYCRLRLVWPGLAGFRYMVGARS